VILQKPWVPSAGSSEQLRRSLDVREQEGDGAGRKLGHGSLDYRSICSVEEDHYFPFTPRLESRGGHDDREEER